MCVFYSLCVLQVWSWRAATFCLSEPIKSHWRKVNEFPLCVFADVLQEFLNWALALLQGHVRPSGLSVSLHLPPVQEQELWIQATHWRVFRKETTLCSRRKVWSCSVCRFPLFCTRSPPRLASFYSDQIKFCISSAKLKKKSGAFCFSYQPKFIACFTTSYLFIHISWKCGERCFPWFKKKKLVWSILRLRIKNHMILSKSVSFY